jgi:hypothetical protein
LGSYSSFRIGDRELYSVKNDIDPLLMSLFRPDEKVIERGPLSEDGATTLPPDDEDVVDIVRYVSTVGILKDRLDLMGFTLPYAQSEFEDGIKGEIERLERWFADEPMDLMVPPYTRQLGILRGLSFDTWSAGFRRIWTEGLRSTRSWLHPDATPLYGELVDYMLGQAIGEVFAFPSEDTRVFLRAALESLDPSTKVMQDLTDLVLGGYFDTTTDLCAYADYLVTADFATTRRIIVLTEGLSDKKALDGGLRVLYPHLAEYFTFMDFEQMNIPGGAGTLVSFVKAFVGAGILNRVIAVFDNDTAANSALRALRGLPLPPNVRVVQYPPLDLCRNYPTLGPTGVSHMDVNGLAGSVELYFGRDVLTRQNGSLTPVLWRGFDQALGRYQGEIMDKAELQARFQSKVLRCLENRAKVGDYDWSAMEAALSVMRAAFHEVDPLDIHIT